MKNRFLILLLIIVFLFVLSVSDLFFFKLPSIMESLEGKLNEVQTKAVDLLVELTKLFITFSIGIIGGLSYFIKENGNEKRTFSKYETTLIIICGGSAIISIYFGHLILSYLIVMLGNDFLSIFENVIVWPVRLQYSFLLMALAALIAFVFEKASNKNNKVEMKKEFRNRRFHRDQR